MKIFILILVLGFLNETPAQLPNSDRIGPELHRLNQDLIQSIKEYKLALEKLRTLYEQNLQRAEDRLAEAKKLFAQQRVFQGDVDTLAQAVELARQKVSDVNQRITAADKRMAAVLLETPSQTLIPPQGSLARDIPTAVQQSEDQVSKVIATAEDHFRKGKMELDANKRIKARDHFDMAVDSILESGLDVRGNHRLQWFYLELVDRIYKEEVPLTRPSVTQAVTELVAQNTSSGAAAKQKTEAPHIGFRDQQFEPSPLDELSRLVLTPGERAARTGKTSLPPGHRTTSQNCNSTTLRGAQLRGFHLAMTASKVRARLPQLKLPVADPSGYSRVSIDFTRTQPPPAFLKGVRTIVFDFIDGRVSYIGVLYDDSIKWRNLDEFTKQVANSLTLPERWQAYIFNGEEQRMLHCGKLRFVAAMLQAGRTRSPGLFLVDDAGIEKLIVRKQQALLRAKKQAEMEKQKKLRDEEERRRTFKP